MGRDRAPMAKSRALAAVLLAVACLLTAGCWDRVEIQERAFVLAVAVDVAEAGADREPGKATVERFARPPSPPDNFRVTMQVMKFGGVKTGEEKPGGESRTYLVTGRGPGMFEAIRDALGESSKGLWFENMQALVFSQAVAERHGLAPLVDFYRRDAEMRWRAQIFVTPGEAHKVLAVQPPSGEPGGIFLANVARRHKKDPHLPTARTDINYTVQIIDAKGDLIFPVLEPVGDTLKIKGGAVFKKGQFFGYVDEYFIKGARMIRAVEKSALITYECPVHPGSAVTFELFRHQTILKPHVEGDRVWFTLDIAMRGNLGEMGNQQGHDSSSVAYQMEAQQHFAAEVRRNIEYALATAQALGWDMLDFKKTLKAYKPRDWERLKDRWDEIYPTMPVYINVRVSIVNVGEHK